MPLHKFLDQERGNRQDGAIVATGRGMGDVIGLPGVEEQDVIGVSNDRFPATQTNEHAAANEHNAVLEVRFLRPFRVHVRPAPEVLDDHAQPLRKNPPRLSGCYLLCLNIAHRYDLEPNEY